MTLPTMIWKTRRTAASLGVALLTSLTLMGCPPGGTTDPDYAAGYLVGFADDDEYWTGFYDSYDTVDGGPIYYSGSEIPYVEDPPYEAGYYDGLWYAYNDGYFVDYDYAFTIGFSEGYDLAFASDGVEFIQDDEHIEWLDGGFSDGYNDGFSEGRVFGAYDWEAGLDFDWLDAMLDYREGTDLTVGGVSTGNSGPVELYVYGTDPNDLLKKDARATKRIAAGYTVRGGTAKAKTVAGKQAGDEVSYRPLPSSVKSDLSVSPGYSPRSKYPLTLTDTWLDRVNDYRAAFAKAAAAKSRRGGV